MKLPISMHILSLTLMLFLGITAARAEDTPVTTLSESVPSTVTDTGTGTATTTEKPAKVKKEKKVKPPKPAKVKEKNIADPNQATPKTPYDSSQAFTKGRMNLGVAGSWFFDFSDYDKIFVGTGVNINDYRNSGFGGSLFFTYNFNPHWALTGDVLFDRLTYASTSRATVRENYFGGDVLVQYDFKVRGRFAPYVAAGAGVIASSGAMLPLIDVGAGAHYFLSNAWSIKVQALFKTAIVYSRIEPSIGVAYHFPNAKPAPVIPPPPPPVKVITLTGINFDTAQWTIRADSVPVLEANVAELTSSQKVTIKIVGHTDHRGSDIYNQGLSEKRAKAVMDWFVAHGVDASRISSEGRGESEPTAPNDTQDNMFKNRRIEIQITGGQ